MKKFLGILAISLLFSFQADAQSFSKNALGLRLGNNNGFGTELNYQRALSEANRLELGLNWRSKSDYNAFKLTGLYHWVWALDDNFNWYAGAGGGLGQVNYDNNNPANLKDETFLVVGGTIGIEYDFDFPLVISFDFRPELGFGDFSDDLDFDIGLGIRYQF